VKLTVQSIDRSSGDCIVELHCVDSSVGTRYCLSVWPCSCMCVGVFPMVRCEAGYVNRPVSHYCLPLAY